MDHNMLPVVPVTFPLVGVGEFRRELHVLVGVQKEDGKRHVMVVTKENAEKLVEDIDNTLDDIEQISNNPPHYEGN